MGLTTSTSEDDFKDLNETMYIATTLTHTSAQQVLTKSAVVNMTELTFICVVGIV